MPKILIVDDEADIVNLIKRYAIREGYEVDTATDGSEAIDICEQNDYDVIIMDVMMQDVDGFTACKKIRAVKDIPVIMLSAKGTEYDKLFGFEVGVDDYVTKPFSPQELMARINVVIKRHGCRTAGSAEISSGTQAGKTSPSDSFTSETDVSERDRYLEVGGIKVDILGHNVYVEGQKTDLTSKEYSLLVYLMKNKGIVLSRDQILNEVWGYDYFGEDRTVDWQIKLLRNKLGNFRDRLITIRGAGYKIED
ncbi:MAG: response regulator transcription factor [Lachnospiraceae bacterium]|nr:response regulator transcription factor [Lachnospiraceae bacterium]